MIGTKPSQETQATGASSAQRAGLWAAVAIATFMASLDNLVVTMALPHIQQDFSTSIQGLTWTVNAYTLPFAIFMLAASLVGDRWGRRRIFICGVVLFGVGSAVAAASSTYAVFIAARAIQGLGAALIVPLALALAMSVVTAQRQALVVAIVSGVQGLGIALGPFVGGAIISFSHWQWVFWINVPLSIAVVGLGYCLPSTQHHRVQHLPVVSLVLLSVGLLGTAAAALSLSANSLLALPWALLALGCYGVGVWNAVRQNHAALPAHLLRNSGFMRSNITALCVTAGIFGIVFILTQYLQIVMNYSPLQAGIATLPWTLLPAVSAPLAGMAVTKIGMRPLITAAAGLQILGLLWFFMVIHPDASYISLLPGMIFAGLGMGVFFALITGQAISFADRTTEGVATGINTSIRESGVLIGIACVGAVFALAGGNESVEGYTVGLRPALIGSISFIALGLISSILTPHEKRETPDAHSKEKI